MPNQNRPYNKIFLALIIFVWFGGSAMAQNEKRTMEAVRVESKIKIDGDLSDEAWAQAKAFEGNFIQLSPDNGATAAYKTKVSIVYNNYGIYVSAIMYDPDPATIPQELGIRDDNDGKNVDQFGIFLDTYNNGQNAFVYSVTAVGVQNDAFASKNDFDENWDAVWKSEVQITDEGWVVEMEIPYSAMRFPKKDEHTWGLNFYRASKRLNEEATWNFVDAEESGFIQQSGVLLGLRDIKPPLRLSFMPFVTGAVTHDSNLNVFGKQFAGGMDVKLGISESFTLDVSLIPDFTQVQSDDQVLNLSPFEVRLDENRPFFTEGLDMFSKGRIFYSRRVGQSFGYVDQDKIEDSEDLRTYPTTASLINATKLSGRTAGGTGIGFFNAISNSTYATLENRETGAERKLLVDPLTNFNVLVIDQTLKNNSYVGLINTNVMRKGGARDANVTLGDFRLRDKSNTWSLSGSGGLSQIFTVEELATVNTTGYKANLYFSKVSGKFQFSTGMNVESDTWEINDMGYQRTNNEITARANVSYNIYKPFSIFNRMNARLSFDHTQLYNPRTFTEARLSFRANTQFRNFYNLGVGVNSSPVDSYDYWEPRTAGRYVTYAPFYSGYIFAGTDNRKPFNLGMHVGRWHRPEDNARNFFGGIGPGYRVSNKLNIDYNLNWEISKDEKGFVTHEVDVNDELINIIFGNRDQNTFVNTLSLSYVFNRNMGLTFRLRHYWSWVEYNKYYDLQDDGQLADSDFNGFSPTGVSFYNTSFNAVNVDMVYTWQIAPGSFVTAVWKDAISSFIEGQEIPKGIGKNFSGVLRESNYNTISLKVVYFIDIAYFRKKIP